MEARRYRTVTEQVVETLREGIAGGRWRGTLPGRHRLADELGVNHKTVDAAMRLLEGEGLLLAQGGTRRRGIAPVAEGVAKRALRVRVLLYETGDQRDASHQELMDSLHRGGYAASHAVKSLVGLGMDAQRVARFVERTDADAWIVCSASREVLEWFAGQKVPAIAMSGRFTGLPIASSSPRIAPALRVAVRRLVELGHRRIVMLAGESRRKPFPALLEQVFLKELDALGLPVGRYSLPDWHDHADGLRDCLDSLFERTPPTALIFGETRFFVAAQQHLARRGIHAPEDISLICSDSDPSFGWCKPAVSHFQWDPDPVVRRVVRWVKNVAAGKEDRLQFLSDGVFVEGGMIGPVKESG